SLALDVKLINTVKIPPREAYTVPAKVEISAADTGYFHPDVDLQTDKSIVVSTALLRIRHIFVKIYNQSEYTQTLYMNTLLGHITHTPSNTASLSAVETSPYGSIPPHTDAYLKSPQVPT
ncbi:unnamed protein product, partial [Didymodactylos carnosus]